MRIFQNIIYDTKLSYGEAYQKVLQCLEENHYCNKRTLFFIEDISEAKYESRTSMAKICKAFPELIPYRYYDHSGKYENNWSRSVMTNLPTVQDGKVKFSNADENITNELIGRLVSKIPRPYSLYGSTIFLDNINWYDCANSIPALETEYPDDPFVKGDVSFPSTPEYQSNCILMTKCFDVKDLEIDIRIEIQSENDRGKVEEVMAHFNKFFGAPTKKYMITCCKPEHEVDLYKKAATMQQYMDTWSKKMIETLLEHENSRWKALQEHYKRNPKEKVLTRNTMEKRFIKFNGLKRSKFRRWDDRSWNKQYPENYFLHIEFLHSFNLGYLHNRKYGEYGGMYITCQGVNFCIKDYVEVGDYDSEVGDISGILFYEILQMYIDAFEQEVLPVLNKIYGNSPCYYNQESTEIHLWKKRFDVYGEGFLAINRVAEHYVCRK